MRQEKMMGNNQQQQQQQQQQGNFSGNRSGISTFGVGGSGAPGLLGMPTSLMNPGLGNQGGRRW